MANNNFNLIYASGNVIFIVKKDVWQNQTSFNGWDTSKSTPVNILFKVSKITQLNTGEFLYLGDDCSVYKVGSSFTNPVFISDSKFIGLTQLSNYKILLTSKDGKMYTVDDVNNFDSTLKLFFNDSTTYGLIKQTLDGYVVAIDSTLCGIAWRFDLVKNQLLNKTQIYIDYTWPIKTILFTPDQLDLLYINCNPFSYNIYKTKFGSCDPTKNTKCVHLGNKPSGCTSNTCCLGDMCFYNPLYDKTYINTSSNSSISSTVQRINSSPVLPDLPVEEGLVGWYDASSFQNNIWYDQSPSNNNAVYIKGTFVNNGTYISGTASSSILFPTQILPPEYTVFNIGKYNGLSQGKILCGYYNNWFSGFANGLSGVSGRDNPITQMSLSAFDDNWVFSLDTNTTYGANGAYYNTLVSTDNTPTQLSINLDNNPNPNTNTNSDFAIACIIVFNRTLSGDEIQSMQSWLTTKYSDLYAGTYTKTFAQLGYSCFNNSIGKVTNNYNNYTYASYKNGTLGCVWLNLPEKNNFNGLVCVEANSEKYETFNNLSENSYIFYILVIILIIILYKKKYKN